MREIKTSQIIETVAKLCKQANFYLPKDMLKSLEDAYSTEKSKPGREVLSEILENARISFKRGIPLCQDTGVADVYIDIGQDVHITDGDFNDAVYEGVRKGYTDGYLRFSMVKDPLLRENTNDNTPPQITTEIVPGNKVKITVLPKGGGSENASTLKMLSPSDGLEGVKNFIIDTVLNNAKNACPPVIIGIGIGGDFSSVTKIAKKSLLRNIGEFSSNPLYAKLEKELLEEINATGIGPMGLGGAVTALAVHIETRPCHIASLPVAVSVQCHSCRRMTETI